MKEGAAQVTLPSMPNVLIRRWYLRQLELIPEADAAYEAVGVALFERAHRAWRIRMYARQTARSLMEDPLEVELLRTRDTVVYKNPDGPTFEGALDRVRNQLQSGSVAPVSDLDVCIELIRSASRSSREVNSLFEA